MDLSEDDEELLNDNPITDFIKTICERADRLIAEDNDNFDSSDVLSTNPFYCQKIETNIYYTFSQLLAWANVMQRLFNSPNIVASLASIGEYYKDMRIYIPAIRQANKFILTDLKSVTADIMAAREFLDLSSNNKQQLDLSKQEK